MSFHILGLLMCFVVMPVFAGGESGGGGDASEERVSEIRSDILKWINDGGSRSLILPNELSHDDYIERMTHILQPQQVVIGFVENDNENDDELRVNVDGMPKTCRGFISKKNQKPHIICSIERFKNTAEAEQYKLIHHEYAGLVRIEKNEGAASDYFISSQITSYLRAQVVLKLAVLKKNDTRPPGVDDPDLIWDLGIKKYDKQREVYHLNLRQIQLFKQKSNKLVEALSNYDTKDRIMNDHVSVCREELESELETDILEIEKNQNSLKQELDIRLQSFKASMIEYRKVYFEVESCGSCSDSVKKDMHERYVSEYANKSKESMGRMRENYSLDVEGWLQRYMNMNCIFDSFFLLKNDWGTNREKQFYEDLIRNDFPFRKGSIGLSFAEILSSKYLDALLYISQKQPVKVVRDSKLFGEPSATFSNGVVNLTWIRREGAYSFPEEVNPIKLIQESLK